MTKRFQVTFLTVVLFLVCYSAGEGADWVLYGEDGTGAKLYYDKESLVRSGNIITVWTRDHDQKNPGDTRSLWEINCAAKRSKLVSFSSHDPDGKVTESTTINYPKWRDIATGSTGETLLKAVCQEEGRN